MTRVETSWSRRRAAVQAEAEAERRAAHHADTAIRQEDLAKKSDAEILETLNLKDPDFLQQGDDFSAFLKAEVPERLRKRALRTLWRSNPVLACVDDLVDYGDDFKAEWNATDLIKTVYRVGKGMLPDVEEVDEPLETIPPDDLPEMVEPNQVTQEAPKVDVANHPPIAALPELEPLLEQDTPLPKARRMRFEFEKVS